jgi:hypothetical protein
VFSKKEVKVQKDALKKEVEKRKPEGSVVINLVQKKVNTRNAPKDANAVK